MSTTSPDIGIRLRPEDKWVKKDLTKKATALGMSLTAYLVLVLKEHIRSKRKLGI